MPHPSDLPPPDALKLILKGLAALDAIMCADWEDRYYAFNASWGDGEQMGSVRNGSGDDVFVLFNAQGCFVKGFAHEFPALSEPAAAFYAGIPSALQGGAREPAFSPEQVSYCVWRLNGGAAWQSGVKESALNAGAFFLLEGLDGDPAHYQAFAEDYYGIEADRDVITAVLGGAPVTEVMVAALNPQMSLVDLAEDFDEIGISVAK